VIQDNEAGILMEVFEAFLSGFITDNMIVLPALECILQQIQDHFIIIDEENKSAHEESDTQI
jgi:hypothetical protein